MLLSFAWLGSTPLPEIYQSLAWFRPGETWTLGILRGVQIIKREVVALTQSLLIRGLRWDSVIANIRNLVPLGVAIIPRIIDNAQKATFASQALEMMGLANLWDRETTKLSGGQQVRLVLAGALASEARTFLLDAPMQELDPEGRVAFMEALAILRSRRPCTIVVADPFWQDLASYTHRVMVLEGGRLLPPLASAEFFSDTWLVRCNLIPLSLEGEGQRVRGSDSLGDIVATLE